jgi:hypothetical protein
LKIYEWHFGSDPQVHYGKNEGKVYHEAQRPVELVEDLENPPSKINYLRNDENGYQAQKKRETQSSII